MTILSRYPTMIVVLLTLSLAMPGCSSNSGDPLGVDAEYGGVAEASFGTDDANDFLFKQTFDMTIELTSTKFNRIRRIPIEYTCTENYYYPQTGSAKYGEDKSPPLEWAVVPSGTVTFAIVADDPDAVRLNELSSEKGITAPTVHWVIWNIPAEVNHLAEHLATTTVLLQIGPNTKQGSNDLDTVGWAGPCPPPNIVSIQRGGSNAKTWQQPHSYRFRIFALDSVLQIVGGSTKNELLETIDGHILAAGELRGEYINKQLYK